MLSSDPNLHAPLPFEWTPRVVLAGMTVAERESLAAILREWEVQLEWSADNADVFRRVREEEPDLVILGSELPGGMTAQQVSQVIKADPLLQSTQIVFLTETNSPEEVRSAIWSGADGCIALLYAPDEIRTRIFPCLRNRSTYRQLQIANERFQKLFVELRALNKEKEHDLKEGSAFQSSLLPGPQELQAEFAHRKTDVSIFHAPFPGAEVSGDFWDIYPLSPESTGLLLADAVGHGIRAAFYSMYTLSALRRIIGTESRDFLRRHSEELFRIMHGTHLSAVYCRFEGDSVFVSNAGMPSPIMVRDGRAESLELYGPVLGGFPEAPPYTETAVEFRGGDILIMCSDGILEAKNGEDEEFGVEGVVRAVSGAAPEAEPINMAIMGALMRFTGDAGFRDDASMLVFRKR